ncbi:putative trace amine-associated receptor 13c-like [Scophthalmus maximus]|uniref:Putative trace amine-associated receptor 13c-like n=1 Tax=Scophthalmus maximus TaxID=52904 RepID=A0A2U9CAK3_SCOMX|nr:trace amine-associated receptor 13c-like [Scophthalmus maximus]AWP13584.1 putative trace amine-associated receptor 13c-like [Scophthalmus maximus]
MMEIVEETELCFPQLLNSSCRKPKRSYSEAVLVYVLLSSIALLTATLNLLVIVSISHFRQLHTPTNLLLLSLGVADFLVGLLMSFQILLTDCWFLSDHVCTLFGVLDFIVTSGSVGTMVLISVDRYVAICDPLHYHSKITVRGVAVCTCLCWAGSVLYNGLILKDNFKQPGRYNSCFGECVVLISYSAGAADLILTFIGPVAVIIVLYMRVFAVAVSQARAMRSHIVAVTLQSAHSSTLLAKKSELKAAKTLGIVVVIFLVCICPYYCSSLVDQNSLFSVTTVPLQNWLFYFNSCLNPLIYAFCYPWFMKSVKLIVSFKILQPDSSEARIL